MTLEEYLGHLNDRLMNEHYESLTVHDVGYNGLAEIVAKAVEMLRVDYVLVHKSHIETQQGRCRKTSGYNVRANLCVQINEDVDVGDIVRNCPSQQALNSLLADRVLKCFKDFIKYLEAPKPEQTQPSQS